MWFPIFLVSVFGICMAAAENKVTVTVYYESLCPDSRQFFTSQLYPALQGSLSKYIDLQLVPFGKSEQTQSDDQWTFKCHHGPDECYGNKVQACALKLIEDGKNTEDFGYNKLSVAFINCLMAKSERKPISIPIQNCAMVNKIQDVQVISNCANHTDGSKYLAEHGKMTMDLKPALTSVPTIVFDKMFNQEDNKLSQSNFVKVLCKYIKTNQPAECINNGCRTLRNDLSLTALLTFAFIAKYLY